MIKTSKIAVLILLVLAMFTGVFASPVVDSMSIKFVLPVQIQVSWKVSDVDGLKKLELYKDNKLAYDEDLTGNTISSLYQFVDDNETHVYKIIVYNINDETVTASKTGGADRDPPQVINQSKIISNSKSLPFETNEPAVCKAGLNKDNLQNLSSDYDTKHSASLGFNEGSNKVFIVCSDKMGNTMPKASELELVLDTTKPSKVQNVKYTNEANSTKITWDASQDTNGIKRYSVSNSLKEIASTTNTYWDVSTNDSIYFITAIDNAGNEGDKQEFNLKREQILTSDLAPAEIKAAPKTEPVNKESTGVSMVAIIAWTIFGMLLIFFAGWKVYEYKSDKHGLRSYLEKRRRMRESR